MHRAVNDEALDILFREARTQNKWQDKPVSTALLMAVYDLMRWGPPAPTSRRRGSSLWFRRRRRNGSSLFSRKAIAPRRCPRPPPPSSAYDLDFARHVPKLFPHAPGAKDWFADPKFAEVAAFRNGTLQGAYFIMAARALGLDCGPMSGFDNAGVDAEFFPAGTVKSNFLCSVGYGDPSGVFPRSPRLSFDEACKIL